MEKEYSQWRDPLMYAMLALALSVLLLAIARFASSRAKIDVSGLKPVPTLALSQDKIDAIVERTRKAGGEIVAYLKTGSAYYSPGASASEMVKIILNDKKSQVSCSALLNGEYGLNDVYMGVPVILGASGVEKIIEIDLTDDEKAALENSVAAVAKTCKAVDEVAI